MPSRRPNGKPRRVKVSGEPYIYERPGRHPRVFEIVWRDAERTQHVRTVNGKSWRRVPSETAYWATAPAATPLLSRV